MAMCKSLESTELAQSAPLSLFDPSARSKNVALTGKLSF